MRENKSHIIYYNAKYGHKLYSSFKKAHIRYARLAYETGGDVVRVGGG